MPPKKILVVDDEPEVRQLMEHFLTERGYEVRIAENGRLALAALDTFKADVVLLDMHMPEMEGLEPVKDAVETTRYWLQWGPADYVPKPFNLDYLEQAINIQLSATRD